jgi:uncharacterized protein YndB with AHSA1/START domain
MPRSADVAGVGDAAVQRATGRRWNEWFAVLDRAGARAKPHREIARLLHEDHGLSGWWSQMVAVGYEQSRGLRRKHEKPDGFQISASRTLAAPIGAAFDALVEARRRARWLEGALKIRKATRPKSVRATWTDRSRLDINLHSKGPGRCQVVVQHGRLPDARAAARMKRHWKAALESLKAYLEG